MKNSKFFFHNWIIFLKRIILSNHFQAKFYWHFWSLISDPSYISETLRKYPVLPFLDRRCNADYKIPGSNLVIEKGIPVYIPLFGLHYDEKHFPDPEKYIPERFAQNVNADKLIHFPFGYGPRICIGECRKYL